jgi:dihydrofolate reductase
MRRLIMWNTISLDGFFEGSRSWDLALQQHAWGPELEAFIEAQARTFGALVLGRVTYSGFAGYWADRNGPVADVLNSVPKIVFSRTLKTATWNNSRIATEKLSVEVGRLKAETGNDVFVLGSGLICTQLAAENLIDEYRFGVVSTILGTGHPLFGSNRLEIPLRVVESTPLGPKCVVLRCVPEKSHVRRE